MKMSYKIYALVLLMFTSIVSAAEESDSVIEKMQGDWLGALNVNGVTLPLTLTLSRAKTGTVQGYVMSPLQAPNVKFPISEINVSDQSLIFNVSSIQSKFEGTWDKTSSSWKGNWSQGGQQYTLTFKIGKFE